MPTTRSTLALLPLCLAVSACNGRSIDPGGDDEVGDSDGGSDWSHPCASPDAPTGPVELVSGAMTPGPFVRVRDRVYWADNWDVWTSDYVHVRWAPVDDPEDWHTVTESPRGVYAMAGNEDAAFWLEGDHGTPSGGLWRIDSDDEPTLLDEGLTRPVGLRHRPGPAGGWLYYGSRAGSTPDAPYQLLRARADGSETTLLAETPGDVQVIDLSPTHLWWGDFSGEIWRLPFDGDTPELVFESEAAPSDMAIVEPHAFVVSITSLYRLTPGAEPEYVESLGDNRGLAATDSHIYFSAQNVFEDNHLGWIHRFPIGGEPFSGEFVTDKFSPSPTEMTDDAHALYWAAADEDTGQGGIWMLCKDNH